MGIPSAMRYTVIGKPVTKKNSARIFRTRTGKPFVMPSKQAVNWTASAIDQLMIQGIEREPIYSSEVNCRALIYRAKRIGDACNFYQAIADALEKAGVLKNDRQIVSWNGSLLLVDRLNPRVEIELTLQPPF